MPAGDSTVTITIQAVNASGPVLQNAERRIGEVGTAGAAANAKLSSSVQKTIDGYNALGVPLGAATGGVTQFGIAGATSAENVNSAMRGTYGSMRLVSGLGREMGLNIDYGLRRALAGNQALIAGLQATIGIFAIIGAVGVLEQVGEGIYHLYERWFDVNKAVEAYQEKAGEAADEKLFDTASIEETVALLKEATDQVDQLQQKRAQSITGFPGGGLLQYAAVGSPEDQGLGTVQVQQFNAEDDAAQAKALENQDKLTEHQRQQNQQLAEEKLKGQSQYDSAVTQGYAHVSAHEKDAIAEINQRYKFMAEQEANLVKIHNDGVKAMSDSEKAAARAKGEDVDPHTADPHAFEQQRQAAIIAAQQEASGQRIELARKEQEEVIRAQNEATDAGLKGEALYTQKYQQDIEAIVRKFQTGELSMQGAIAQTDALSRKYDADRLERLQQQQYETQKIQQEAAGAGLTGIAHVEYEGAARISDLYANPTTNAAISDEQKQQHAVALQQQTDKEVLAEQQRFGEELAQITEHNADQVLTGYAKIDAETRQSLGEIAKDFEQTFGHLDFFNPADLALLLQGLQQAQTAIDSVMQNAQRERLKYTQDTDRQIEVTEAEAARALLPPWEAAQQKIIDDYNQRVLKIHDALQQQVDAEKGNTAIIAQLNEQASREAAAAWTLANAEMVKQSEQARDQLAGQLKSLFDNPAKYMEERAKQVMFDIFANWLQQAEQNSPRLQGVLGGILGQNKVGTGSPQHALGQLFGLHGAQQSTLSAQPLELAGNTLNIAGSNMITAASTLLAAGQLFLGRSSTSGDTGASGPELSDSTTSALRSAGFNVGNGGNVVAGGFGGAPSTFSGESLGQSGGPLGTASSVAGLGGAIGGAAGASSPASNITAAVQQGLSLTRTLQSAFSSSGSTATSSPLLGSSGSVQPGAHVLSDEESGSIDNNGDYGDDSSIDGGTASGSGIGGLLGAAGGLISGGLAAYGGIEAAANSKTFASGLIGAGSTALAGASIGTLFAPGIGTAIGAAVGFAAGLAADIFGDHGASQMQRYNTDTVIPSLLQAENGLSFGGSSYDSAALSINQINLAAQKQAKEWGSGAWGVYTGTVEPEIDAAEATITREGAAGRSNVKFGVSQFHEGGPVLDFGGLWTSPSEGFAHLELGETVMTQRATSTHGPWLSAINQGKLDLNSLLGATPRAGGSSGSNGGETHLHFHINSLDSKDTERWLKNGGGLAIQTHLNQLASRYAGKALNGS